MAEANSLRKNSSKPSMCSPDTLFVMIPNLGMSYLHTVSTVQRLKSQLTRESWLIHLYLSLCQILVHFFYGSFQGLIKCKLP